MLGRKVAFDVKATDRRARLHRALDAVMDAKFNESAHKRDASGKFGSGSGTEPVKPAGGTEPVKPAGGTKARKLSSNEARNLIEGVRATSSKSEAQRMKTEYFDRAKAVPDNTQRNHLFTMWHDGGGERNYRHAMSHAVAKDDYIRDKMLRIDGVKFIFSENDWGVDPSDQDGYGDTRPGYVYFKRNSSAVKNILADMGISPGTVETQWVKWCNWHTPKAKVVPRIKP
jgi:hypothetical protein